VTNPWDAIYKMAAGKTKRATHITTEITSSLADNNLQNTLLHIIQKFAPDDNQEDDTDTHSQIRTLTQKPLDTEDDDEEFTVQEVTNAKQDMGNNKTPGEVVIPNEVWKCVGTMLPRYMTAIYNGCLRKGLFPKRWKKARIIPIVKPCKEGNDEVNMFRSISLLDSGGKVLEKLLINRINHHAYSRGHMNENHFGFRPQKSTVDAAMAIKAFVQESLDAGEVKALIVLDVQGAFDAAWWPGVLRELRES